MTLAPPRRQSYLLAIPAVILLWLGFRNHTDPTWLEASQLLHEKPVLLYEMPDSLQRLYCEKNKLKYVQGDSSAWWQVAYPDLSNVEWDQFMELLDRVEKERHLVVSGVTGAGATKYAKHVARTLTSGPEYLIEINCAPQFDLEYHKKYIGYETEEGFQSGLLLQFWEQALNEPEQRFFVVADNLDKINPETFFGPELWEAMSSSDDTLRVAGQLVTIPPNFYLLSVTHLAPASLVEFNEEHFKRLGPQYIIQPNPRELLARLRRQAIKIEQSEEDGEEKQRHLQALRDSSNLHQYLYYFIKTNQILKERYGVGYQLGQGSNIRSLYRKEDRQEFQRVCINHLTALHPDRPLKRSTFRKIEGTIANAGLEPGSNFFARQIRVLQDSGYLVEITMVATTALLTALVGWWVFRRREQLMRLYGDRAQEIFNQFETHQLGAEDAANQLYEIKAEVDLLVMRRRLNYTEALYFLAFIDDKVKRIEFARNVSQNFLELFNTFMEDDVLSENEYLKLMQFLQSIRHKIPEEAYIQFYNKVENTYRST